MISNLPHEAAMWRAVRPNLSETWEAFWQLLKYILIWCVVPRVMTEIRLAAHRAERQRGVQSVSHLELIMSSGSELSTVRFWLVLYTKTNIFQVKSGKTGRWGFTDQQNAGFWVDLWLCRDLRTTISLGKDHQPAFGNQSTSWTLYGPF